MHNFETFSSFAFSFNLHFAGFGLVLSLEMHRYRYRALARYHTHLLLLILDQISPIYTTNTTSGKYDVVTFSRHVGAMLWKLLEKKINCVKVKMSAVWKHFQISDDDNSKADCKLCSSLYQEEEQRQLTLILVI